MTRDIIGEIIFWATLVFASVLYVLSAPSGLPWSGSTELALAYSGYIAALPDMSHPVWGYFIQVFGGHYVALSVVAAAIAGGLIGALVNRYLGWRLGVVSALAWVVMPPVWNRAITGAHGAFWMFGIVFSIWLANVAFLVVTRRARQNISTQGAENSQAAMTGFMEALRRSRINRVAMWILLGATVIGAIVAISHHDYTLGNAASVYARMMLDEAGDRIVVLNGVADNQMVWEAERRKPGSSDRLIQYREDHTYRTQLVARVRREFPSDTNLWVSTQIGVSALAEILVRRYPDRVYVMTGQTTTIEKWAARWEKMKPFLNSVDGFIPVMRHAFAYEGNVIGGELQKAGKLKEAWSAYARVFTEIDAHNGSAVVNLSEMLRRGYKADVQMRTTVDLEMKLLNKAMKDGDANRIAESIMSECGPIHPDEKILSKYREMIAKRMKELEKDNGNGDRLVPAEWKSLVEWSNEMVQANDSGNFVKAARIARTILSKPEWRSFIPANAIMGATMSAEGDFVASEAFYRIAVTGKEKPPAIVCNDYADTLMHLGRLDEAERYARLAVAETKDGDWICRLTLAQVLKVAGKNPDEIKALLKIVLKYAPAQYGENVRKEFSKLRP